VHNTESTISTQGIFTRYSEYGLPLIQLHPSDKKPIQAGWSRYCVTLPLDSDVESWDRALSNASYNFGLALGPSSGIMALDIDTDHPGTLAVCPLSPVRKRGLVGETRFFKYNPAYDTRRDLRTVFGIEILSTGTQTVLPPSLHPKSGKRYEWLTPDTFPEFKASDLPEFNLAAFIHDLPRIGEGPKAEAFVEGRNNKLCQMIQAIRHKGKSDQETVREVVDFDLATHTVPLFLDASEGNPGTTILDAERNAFRMVLGVSRTMAQRGQLTLNKPVIEAFDVMAELRELETAHREQLPLSEPTGLLLEMRNAILAQSPKHQPVFALAGAMSILAAFACGRYSMMGIWPALYSLCLGSSTSGKDSTRKFFNKLMADERLAKYNLIGMDTYESSQAAVADLVAQRCRLDIHNEFSRFLNDSASKDGKMCYATATELIGIWDVSGGYYGGLKSLAAKRECRSGACMGPAINLLAFAQPERVTAVANGNLMSLGFLPRFLFWNVRSRAAKNTDFFDVSTRAIPESIIEGLLARFPNPDVMGGRIDASNGRMGADPKEIGFDPALAGPSGVFATLWGEYDDKSEETSDPTLKMYYSRVCQQVQRVALIFAVSDDSGVTIEIVERAHSLVKTLLVNASELIVQASANSDYDRNMQLISALLLGHKKESISIATLLKRVARNMTLREFNDALDSLWAQRAITVNRDKHRITIVNKDMLC